MQRVATNPAASPQGEQSHSWQAAEAAYRLATQLSDEAYRQLRHASQAVGEALTGADATNWPKIHRDPRVAPLVEAEDRARAALGAAEMALVKTPATSWQAFTTKLELIRERADDVLNPLDLRDRKAFDGCEADFPGTTACQTLHHAALGAHLGILDPKMLPYLPGILAELCDKLAGDTDEIVLAGLPALRRDLERLVAEGPSAADAQLLAFGEELECRWATHRLDTRGVAITNEELDAVTGPIGEIVGQIDAAPATTLAGFRVKARALAWRLSAYDRPLDDCPAEAVNLLNELIGYRGKSPDAELVELGERYKRLSRENHLLGGYTAHPIPPAVERRIRALNAELNELRRKSRTFRATSREAMRVKAIIALDWQPTRDEVEFDNESFALTRSLIADVLELPDEARDGGRDAFWIAEGFWPSDDEVDQEHAAALAQLGAAPAPQVAA